MLAARPLDGAVPSGAGQLDALEFLLAARAGWVRRSVAASMRQTSAAGRPPPRGSARDRRPRHRWYAGTRGGRGLDEAQVLEVLVHSRRAGPRAPRARASGQDAVRPRCRGRRDRLGQDRRPPRGLPLLLSVGDVLLPVRAALPDIPAMVRAAVETAETGATEFCIVAAVRGPDAKLMAQMRAGVTAIRAAVDINIAASLGMLSRPQVDELAEMGIHRYNHNLETARSYFPSVVTTHTWEELGNAHDGPGRRHGGACRGGIVGMGETLAQRAEFAVQLAGLGPDEVPLNFLNPRPGTPFGDRPVLSPADALRGWRVPAGPTANDPAVRRRTRDRARRSRDAGRPARRGQRSHRRQLPDDAGPPSPGGSGVARRSPDADQGTVGDPLTASSGRSGSASAPTSPADPNTTSNAATTSSAAAQRSATARRHNDVATPTRLVGTSTT